MVPSLTPMPRTPDAWISLRHVYRLGQQRQRALLIDRRGAALPSSQDLTGPPYRDEPRVLKGRRGGTDEFLGRGAAVPPSPWSSGQGGRPLDKCLVQRHADTVLGKLPAAVSEAVNRSPVLTTWKKDYSSLVRGAPVDRRGHIRVRQQFEAETARGPGSAIDINRGDFR